MELTPSKEQILFIVESPNKCKTIKEFLPSNYLVVASVGHIVTIADGGNYWNTGINPWQDFLTTYKIIDGKDELVKQLRQKVQESTKVILATDPDREGEVISYTLLKVLEIPENKYERITYHEVTKKAILTALEHPRKINMELVDAGMSRSIIDKLMGYRLSPIARKNTGAVSVGRCQSAGLLLIANREKQIQNFIKTSHYDLYLQFMVGQIPCKAKLETDVALTKEQANRILQNCNNDIPVVLQIDNETSLENAQPPFCTSTLQQTANKILHMTVNDIMSCAQKLFEGININGRHIAVITYIRTDDTTLAPEFETVLSDYVKKTFGENYFASSVKSKVKANVQGGHEAIRPVSLTMTPRMLKKYINDEKMIDLYDLIYRRTIASHMSSAKYVTTTYHIGIKEYLFKLSFKHQVFNGFKYVYSFSDDVYNTAVPELKLHDTVNNGKLKAIKKTTTPPERYSEATFINALNTYGIGRPSTYATIISTLLSSSRGYCELVKNKYIQPTACGMKLSEFLSEHFSDLINVKFTANMETRLDDVAEGKETKQKLLTSFMAKLTTSTAYY